MPSQSGKAGSTLDEAALRVPRRGKPSPAQSAAITRTIIEVATELFLTEGYDGTAMEAIAARAGIPKPTLYKRFPDKRELLQAVLVARVSSWGRVASRQNAELTSDLGQRLRQYVATMLVWSATPEVLAFKKLFASAFGLSGESHERYAFYGHAEMTQIIALDIAEYGPPQGYHARQPMLVAEILMALVSGWLERPRDASQMGEMEAAREADLLVSIVLHGKDAW